MIPALSDLHDVRMNESAGPEGGEPISILITGENYNFYASVSFQFLITSRTVVKQSKIKRFRLFLVRSRFRGSGTLFSAEEQIMARIVALAIEEKEQFESIKNILVSVSGRRNN